jgi:hypothetical protein
MGKAMTNKLKIKSSRDFADPAEWREYVRAFVPDEDVNYVLAFERTQLFLCFYRLRGMKPPVEVKMELDRIAKLNEPERTEALEAFNDLLLATATMQLMSECKSSGVSADHSDNQIDPREQIDTLLDHLGRTSPYYRYWRDYTGSADCAGRLPWGDLVTTIHSLDPSKSAKRDGEYAVLIGQLGQLLAHFRDNNLPLPPLLFERIWFLNWLRGPQRNLQARAVLQGLTEAMKPCASA